METRFIESVRNASLRLITRRSNHYRAIWHEYTGGGEGRGPFRGPSHLCRVTRGETRHPKRPKASSPPPPPPLLPAYARKSSSIHEFRLKPQSDVIRAKGNGLARMADGEIIENTWREEEGREANGGCKLP